MSIRVGLVICLIASTLGCRAYREKKAEFMMNDARSMADPAARVRAMVEADCFIEVDKAPPDAPETIACRKTAGPKRIAEAERGANGEEAAFFAAWRACFADSDGTSGAWSSCEAEAREAVVVEEAPPPPVMTSTTSTTA